MKARDRVTVVLIANGAAPLLGTSLYSLSSQSLEPTDFDVVIVFRDPDILDNRLTHDLLTDYSNLNIDFVSAQSDAESLWLEVSSKLRAPHVTFLREGEYLSRGFLQASLNSAGEGIIPITQVQAHRADTVCERLKTYNEAVLSREYPVLVEPTDFGTVLDEVAGRMVPTRWLHERIFFHALNQNDLLFNVSLAAEYGFVFSRFPASVGAIHYRAQRQDSAAPHSESDRVTKDFVRELEYLQSIQENASDRSITDVVQTAYSMRIASLRQRSGDEELRTVFKQVADSGLRGLPWAEFAEPVTTLAIIANFAPYSGTAGIVAAKRIVETSDRVDVISSVMSSRVKHDEDLLVSEPYVRRHKILSPDLRALNDRQIRGFIDGGLNVLHEWQALGAHYSAMYSRSMMPYSHFLAAAIKKENPRITWKAEFSDPNSLDVEGNVRSASFKSTAVTSLFEGLGTKKQQEMLKKEKKIYRWAELLPYFFADELIFTNENQLEIMLEYAPLMFRELIRDKAIVKHHPTLPRGYYGLAEGRRFDNINKIKIAYFGDFYKTRGMTELVEAFDSLCDEKLDAFRLMIFTGSQPETIYAQFSNRVKRIVDIQPRLNYLTFLATLDEMDCLIVNDANTKQYFNTNPYLPSKVSDYRGSSSPRWAIVERGSPLSLMDSDYKSELGDTSGALSVLNKLLDEVES